MRRQRPKQFNTNQQLNRPTNPGRRHALGAIGAWGLTTLTGCIGSSTSDLSEDLSEVLTESTDNNTEGDTSTVETGQCVLIPQETEGPFPLSAVLSNSAIVRQNMTEGKTGVPLTVQLKLIDVNNNCSPITNSAAVYIWHCDKDGLYSGYSQPGGSTVGETFLRGIQDVDSNGVATFTTIYPGWYPGRITHIHLQVFLYGSSVATATSQIAFPAEVTTEVYNTALYTKGQNTSVTSFSQDNVFRDGTSYQMADIVGNVDDGLTATLVVGIAAS